MDQALAPHLFWWFIPPFPDLWFASDVNATWTYFSNMNQPSHITFRTHHSGSTWDNYLLQEKWTSASTLLWMFCDRCYQVFWQFCIILYLKKRMLSVLFPLLRCFGVDIYIYHFHWKGYGIGKFFQNYTVYLGKKVLMLHWEIGPWTVPVMKDW